MKRTPITKMKVLHDIVMITPLRVNQVMNDGLTIPDVATKEHGYGLVKYAGPEAVDKSINVGDVVMYVRKCAFPAKINSKTFDMVNATEVLMIVK